ncbi:hypothetical protein GQ42DRAFT_82940 [Ramicandelaber brevisporus]|nr:hypothetical protein GQ42DRAFT_82940 [Ramicandelaber brevisporus]
MRRGKGDVRVKEGVVTDMLKSDLRTRLVLVAKVLVVILIVLVNSIGLFLAAWAFFFF